MALVVYILVILGTFSSVLSTFGEECEPYYKNGQYQWKKTCFFSEHCCGNCTNRFCCSSHFMQFTKDEQKRCKTTEFDEHSILNRNMVMFGVLMSAVVLSLLLILCCVCPCCCLYKKYHKPQPVVAATNPMTLVTTTQYPQSPISTQQHPGYYPSNKQHPGHYSFNQQHLGYQTPAPYGGQPMPSATQQGPVNTEAPPAYWDDDGPGEYPINYGVAAFTPGQ
ncbi:protein shisa-5-like [Engraulis encrasicolus]|uniref:protein shisa-5-like n=1 Tax=Engraulis encrasicolus TaxID=184585 RepID=UPI002FD50E93